jgi:hypothetical protein
VRQNIGNSCNAIGEQDWKMEHVEEIGSSLRHCHLLLGIFSDQTVSCVIW